MKNVLGIVFADSHYDEMGALTTVRPLGALPIAGRYRMIDFVLSNMVNSGMINVAVVTQSNYHSLMDHLGSGKQYNLSRKRYGLTLFPPFSEVTSSGSDSRIDVLYGLLNYLYRSQQEYVLISESNIIENRTFTKMYEKHLQSGADVTVAYQDVGNMYNDESVKFEGLLYTDKEDNITDVEIGSNVKGSTKRYMGHILINKQTLIQIIETSKVRGKKGYLTNLITRNIGKLKIVGYETTWFARKINVTEEFYKLNMDLLNREVRNTLFKTNPIYTKEKDMTPTVYKNGAKVTNSFIADGCTISGNVENCILFRNVTVKEGATVKNSIIFENGIISADAFIENVIADKDVIIRDNKKLVGADSFPIVVNKGKVI